jgi:branched-chain amino acid transport system permease protein
MFSLGLVALSFVPLAGYAGQISLCQLSMAGIGALVWAHLGSHGELWALGAAIVISALAGALIALPALRLSGVYLALGTAAFAVVLDRWIFTLPSFHIFGVPIALFEQSSVEVATPQLFGFRVDNSSKLMVFAALSLALASLAVAALRRSRFGRRLIAMQDSEAAYATLGGNLLMAKVLVFALAAGIAGLGGALYGMQLGSITADQFNFVAGLPIFLVAVIGGLGAVGAGLFAGTALIGPLTVLVNTVPWTQNLVAMMPSLAGIGMAQSPSGIISHWRHDWAPLARDRRALLVLLAGVALGWLLWLEDVVGGWVFFGALLVLALVLRAYTTARQASPGIEPLEADDPLEWRGIRRPWRAEDREVLDRGIAGS